MHVRRARARDLPAVAEATARAYAAHVLGPDDPYLDRLRDAAGRAREAELWVAVEQDGTDGAERELVLGSVTDCPPGSPWREVAGPDEGEFRMLAVDPAAAGRGAATALVQHVLDAWRARGARSVVLSTLPDMAAAHRLYARFGFVRVPARDWSPVPGVELLVYELELSRAAT